MISRGLTIITLSGVSCICITYVPFSYTPRIVRVDNSCSNIRPALYVIEDLG